MNIIRGLLAWVRTHVPTACWWYIWWQQCVIWSWRWHVDIARRAFYCKVKTFCSFCIFLSFTKKISFKFQFLNKYNMSYSQTGINALMYRRHQNHTNSFLVQILTSKKSPTSQMPWLIMTDNLSAHMTKTMTQRQCIVQNNPR